MVKKRFTILFRLKKPVGYVDGNMLVYMRITVDAMRTEVSINREFDPLRWNKISGRASGNKEEARSLNAYMDTLQVKVYEANRDLSILCFRTPCIQTTIFDTFQISGYLVL